MGHLENLEVETIPCGAVKLPILICNLNLFNMNKKLFCAFILLFVFGFSRLFTQFLYEPDDPSPILFKFESFSDGTVSDGVITINGQVLITDTIMLDSGTVAATVKYSEMYNSNYEFSISSVGTSLLPNVLYYPGYTGTFTLSFSYNTAIIPDELQNIDIEIAIGSEGLILPVSFYFTPYNSVEVWSEESLEVLLRPWSYDAGFYSRKSVDISDIPASNLTTAHLIDPDYPKSYYSVEGLGYTIPVEAVLDTFDLVNTDSASGKDGCVNDNWQKWKGHIRGHIESEILINSNTPTWTRMTGLKVQLMEKDAFPNPDDHLGVSWLDDNGNFDIFVDVCQKYKG
jgi:hypothetical protein